MKLECRVRDPELLFSLTHELGTLFFRRIGKSQFEVVYFARNKFIYFKGELNEEQQKRLESMGFEVNKIEVDDIKELIKVEQ